MAPATDAVRRGEHDEDTAESIDGIHPNPNNDLDDGAPQPPPDAEHLPRSTTPAAPYSAFSSSSKRSITALVALAGFFSPLSANIYFPALDAIAQDLGVTLELMNLTITAYLICQCVAPAVWGDWADVVGRRPVYLLVLGLYVAASLGLTVQHSYAGLLVLRVVQSAGASGTIALGNSVMHDIAAPHERGRYMGIAMSGPNAAPSLGPVLGGVLAEEAGWRWIFGFLSILSGLSLLVMLICFPETGRNIVGDESGPARGLNRTLISYLKQNPPPPQGAAVPRPPLRFPNPIASLRIIFHKDIALILYANGIFYMNYQCIQASLSPLVIQIYGLNALQAGLCYLPYGLGCTLASYLTGLIIDRDYRRTAAAIRFPIDHVRGDDLARFPIERARLRSIWAFMSISIAGTLGYGWALHIKTNLAVPLTLQFLCGLSVTGTFNVLRTLMIDLHPANPATASAAVNIIRGTVAALGVSLLPLWLQRLGVGPTFSLLAALAATALPVLALERRCGMAWRGRREGRAREREREREREKGTGG